MKVTAFIRKTAAKNNITDQARVYFRVRDIGGVDIKAASELSINPNHWSPERQGYKPRVALVSEEKKMGFDKDVQQITHLITKEYHRGVDGSWLKSLIEEYHRPGINARGGNKADEYLLSYQIRKYVEETPLADESRKHHLDNLNKVLRYERFRHEVLHQRGFHLCIDTITAYLIPVEYGVHVHVLVFLLHPQLEVPDVVRRDGVDAQAEASLVQHLVAETLVAQHLVEIVEMVFPAFIRKRCFLDVFPYLVREQVLVGLVAAPRVDAGMVVFLYQPLEPYGTQDLRG